MMVAFDENGNTIQGLRPEKVFVEERYRARVRVINGDAWFHSVVLEQYNGHDLDVAGRFYQSCRCDADLYHYLADASVKHEHFHLLVL